MLDIWGKSSSWKETSVFPCRGGSEELKKVEQTLRRQDPEHAQGGDISVETSQRTTRQVERLDYSLTRGALTRIAKIRSQKGKQREPYRMFSCTVRMPNQECLR